MASSPFSMVKFVSSKAWMVTSPILYSFLTCSNTIYGEEEKEIEEKAKIEEKKEEAKKKVKKRTTFYSPL